MIWAAICYDGKSRLVRFDTTNSQSRRQGITASIYRDQIINGPLREFITAMTMIYPDSQVLEDNTPVHTASLSRSQGLNNGYSFINHPPSSPNLNPIKNCWHWLKMAIRQLPRRPTNHNELFDAASRLWDEMPQSLINNVILSMPKRLEMVRKYKGFSTKY